MEFERFDPERDRKDVHRIWAEVGWTDLSNEDRVKAMDCLLDAGDGWVVRQNDAAECAVFTGPGDLAYLNDRLPLTLVSAVTTSRVARKQGYAMKLTAHAIAEGVAKGSLVTGLGMFEQGYYNQLGFGSGGYCTWLRFSPQDLLVDGCRKIPERLTLDDVDAVHEARRNRWRAHGTWALDSPNHTREWILMHPNNFGLGFRDPDTGKVTHFIWCYSADPENGPYSVLFYAFKTREEFIDLLGVIKNLGDQVHRIGMMEPPGIQMTDLVSQPIRSYLTTLHSKGQMGVRSIPVWQLRINDLAACLAKTRLQCDEFRFNLKLADPIARHLPKDAPWKGCGGEYVVTLGRECAAEPGEDASLDSLETTVCAISRMWLGVRPASGLSFTDDLSAPESLIAKLDTAFRLPSPKRSWPC